jgi:hypothetical protein
MFCRSDFIVSEDKSREVRVFFDIHDLRLPLFCERKLHVGILGSGKWDGSLKSLFNGPSQAYLHNNAKVPYETNPSVAA